jgi:uncharacterized protein (DUF2225 family)
MIERSMSLMNMSWLFYILNDKDPTLAFYSARKDKYDYVAFCVQPNQADQV